MLNTLVEKRAELEKRLSAAIEARQVEIEKKVEEYRQTLEMTTSYDDIDKLKSVIVALDEVIQYDSLHTQTQPETVAVRDERPVARQGMATVVVPR